jgi:hypothetical protein
LGDTESLMIVFFSINGVTISNNSPK